MSPGAALRTTCARLRLLLGLGRRCGRRAVLDRAEARRGCAHDGRLGVGLALLASAAGARAGLAREGELPEQPLALGVDHDVVAGLDLAEEDLLRQGVLDLALDRTAQRP